MAKERSGAALRSCAQRGGQLARRRVEPPLGNPRAPRPACCGGAPAARFRARSGRKQQVTYATASGGCAARSCAVRRCATGSASIGAARRDAAGPPAMPATGKASEGARAPHGSAVCSAVGSAARRGCAVRLRAVRHAARGERQAAAPARGWERVAKWWQLQAHALSYRAQREATVAPTLRLRRGALPAETDGAVPARSGSARGACARARGS